MRLSYSATLTTPPEPNRIRRHPGEFTVIELDVPSAIGDNGCRQCYAGLRVPITARRAIIVGILKRNSRKCDVFDPMRVGWIPRKSHERFKPRVHHVGRR